MSGPGNTEEKVEVGTDQNGLEVLAPAAGGRGAGGGAAGGGPRGGEETGRRRAVATRREGGC